MWLNDRSFSPVGIPLDLDKAIGSRRSRPIDGKSQTVGSRGSFSDRCISHFPRGFISLSFFEDTSPLDDSQDVL